MIKDEDIENIKIDIMNHRIIITLNKLCGTHETRIPETKDYSRVSCLLCHRIYILDEKLQNAIRKGINFAKMVK